MSDEQKDLNLIMNLAEHMKQSELMIRNYANLMSKIKELEESINTLIPQVMSRLNEIEKKLGLEVTAIENNKVVIDISKKYEIEKEK